MIAQDARTRTNTQFEAYTHELAHTHTSPKKVMPRRLDELLKVKQIAGCDTFSAFGLRTAWGRLFGGQILGQAIVAAAHTVEKNFLVHSLHAYFLLAGDSRKKILYEVERIHDGRSFARRRVTGKQMNRVIFVVTASFKTAEGDPQLEFQWPHTEMISLLKHLGVARSGKGMGGNLPSPEELIARGVVPERDSITGHTINLKVAEGDRFLIWWRKHERKLPPKAPWSDHAALVAYITDRGTVNTVRQPFNRKKDLWDNKGVEKPHEGIPWGGPSLDHAIHFHRRFRADDWHLYYQTTDITSGGRGLADIKILTNDGKLVASCTQEALMRLPRSRL